MGSDVYAAVIVGAHRRAAHTSEATNAEAPVWAAYRLPFEYPEIGVFRITDDSIYLLRTNASPKGVPMQLGPFGSFRVLSGSFESVRVLWIIFGSFRILLGSFGCLRVLSGFFECFRVLSGSFVFKILL